MNVYPAKIPSTILEKLIKTIKPLLYGLKNKGGRSFGYITAPRRKSLCKRTYRFLDFKRVICPKEAALVLSSIYDPSRSSAIALICFPYGIITKILLPSKVKQGDFVQNCSFKPRNLGDSSALRQFASGVLLHNISLNPKGIGQLTRSAGCSTYLVIREHNTSLLKLKSGEMRYFNSSVTATLGVVGNENHFLRDLKKAGNTRLLGKRSRTRPSSMNPVDHPMGGRTRGGFQPTNAKGIITLNRPTKKIRHAGILYTKRQMKFRRF